MDDYRRFVREQRAWAAFDWDKPRIGRARRKQRHFSRIARRRLKRLLGRIT